jgi:hypothetical protein
VTLSYQLLAPVVSSITIGTDQIDYNEDSTIHLGWVVPIKPTRLPLQPKRAVPVRHDETADATELGTGGSIPHWNESNILYNLAHTQT